MSTVAYLRRSSAPNADTRTVSFEMQQSAVEELARSRGHSIEQVFSDWARSGGNARRPGYQKLLAAIDDGTVDTIYSYSLSRLSRSLGDFADLLERCKARKVRISLVKDGDIDVTTATGRGYAGMVANFAQMEREIAQERIQSAVDARRDRGDHLGQAPYGFQVVKGKLVRRTDEEPREVLDAFQEAGSFGGAARLLNERGVPTRRNGTQWNHGTVADIIRQQFPDEAPKALARARAKPRTGKRLAGLLRCHCGSTLTPRSFGGVIDYYCSRSYRIPNHGRTAIREERILPAIKAEVGRLSIPHEAVEIVEASEAEQAQLTAKRERIIDLMADGLITKAEGERRLDVIAADLAKLDEKLALVAIPDVDWSAPPDRLNAVLRALFQRVELDADTFQPSRFEWAVPEWRSS